MEVPSWVNVCDVPVPTSEQTAQLKDFTSYSFVFITMMFDLMHSQTYDFFFSGTALLYQIVSVKMLSVILFILFYCLPLYNKCILHCFCR